MLSAAILALTFVGAGFGIALGYAAWGRRGVPGANTYAVLITVQGLWALAYGIELAASSRSTTLLFDMFVTLFSVAAAFSWLLFVLEYTGRSEWLRPRRLVLLALEPVAYFALYVTNPIHGFAYTGFRIEESAGLSYVVPDGTALFYAQLLIVYAVLALGVALLGAFVLRSRNFYRKQSALILGGAIVVIVGNLFWVANSDGLDLTPIFFVGNGLVVGWALFRYNFLDVTPLVSDVLVEEMNDPVVVVDESRRLIDYNGSAETALGLTEADIGEAVTDSVAAVLDATSAGDPVLVDDRTADTDAETVYQPNRTQLTDSHGIVRGELIVLRDITSQKRREERLEALQAGTRDLMDAETKADVASLVTETVTSILEYPYSGVLLYDDEREELVSGSISDPTRAKLDGKEMRIDDGIVWETFESGEMRILDRAALERGQYAGLSLECVLIYPLGEHGVLGVGSDREMEFSDGVVRFLEILALTAEAALDSAEREELLERRRVELRERNERLNEFADIVSHDLRNPLNTAEGYLELARDDPDEAYFEEVAAAHDRMQRLIEDVLTFAREGEDTLETEAVSVEALAREAWSTAGSERGRLVVEADAVVRADPGRLRTVFENLFRNAREHGSGTVTVAVRAIPGENRVIVEDDGPGIDPEVREAIFKRGYSTDDEGTGFGLSIVQQISRAHGWSVSAGSRSGGGAQFTFDGVDFE